MRNSNFYELGLVHPQVPPFHSPAYGGSYSDNLDAIDKDGNIHVTEGPGMGVTLDWNYIEKHQTGRVTYDQAG